MTPRVLLVSHNGKVVAACCSGLVSPVRTSVLIRRNQAVKARY